MTGDQHRVDRRVRMRAVAAAPVDRDLDAVRRRHRRAGRDADAPRRQAGPVVERVHLLGREALEQPVLDHRLGAGVALLSRLEDEIGGAVEIARLVQVARGGEQHRRVPVVAAAMHPPVVTRLVREVVFLLHRQRVHVRAQADGAAARVGPAANDGNDAGPADPRVVLDAECREPLADDLRGPVLLEAELRVHVQVAAQCRELGVPARDVQNGIRHGCGRGAADCRMRRRTKAGNGDWMPGRCAGR